MVIGDPNKFAIIIDMVPEWNITKSFKMGVFLYVLKANIFPKEIDTVTLSSDLYYFFERTPSALLNIPKDEKLFQMELYEAYKFMLDTFCSASSTKNNKNFCFTSLSIRDYNYEFFAVSNGVDIRILKGKIGIDYCISEVEDIILPKEYIDNLVIELRDFYNKNIKSD
ncbi:Imm42 family immunity protein [Myroides sp. DF42-4-2]|uniref:Imm42 family immunity protein n=1 Tax=Myroides sp. DF42-4-2 TaxID=2746726 RepID=UPI0025770A8D|nr:Imm42 family immunity protein [Myroides sp. DF42-4-2]MDM1408404.1 hypothetical protein [Myroides sp. DF42-4-2]